MVIVYVLMNKVCLCGFCAKNMKGLKFKVTVSRTENIFFFHLIIK